MSTTIEQNVAARQAAEQALQLVIDYGKELELSPEATAHYWKCIEDEVRQIRGTWQGASEVERGEPTIPLSELWSTDTSDDVVMPKGKHEGQLATDVPSHYFEWLADQEWIEVAEDWSEVADWMRNEGYL